MKDRMVNYRHAQLIKAFFDSQPLVPGLDEAPAGWHIYLDRELLICGEGEFWKTPYTPSNPGNPPPESVDLNQ